MNTIMKMFFVLASCLALASVAPGAEEQNKNKPAPKKKAAAPAHAAQPSQHAVAPARHPAGHPSQHAIAPAGHTSQHAIAPAGNARLQTQRNVSTAPLRGTPRGQANAQRFKAQHFNLPTKTPPTTVAALNFQQGRHIQGSQNWQGSKYTVFRNYSSQWHDRNWWSGRYNRVVFVYGGWYAWNGGYWIPAWGYAPNAYYAYDGPIYGYNGLPPDQVTANVQSALQQQGYYHGEVDGLLGPLTRAAIADYQRDHGLYMTSAIDEPTLSSLGMT